MSVYLVMDIEIVDEDAYSEYRRQVPAVIEQFGGRYLARGGKAKNVDGDWQPNRVVIVEFDSDAQARDFLTSSDYAPLLAIRHSAAVSRGILVESAP
jgi:uncharacterized protein (DUF1330 family)|tara:strand:- start:8117 stop:8407 length:291 start_codon:yes stop_codon:yes gene_type:complete